MLLDSYHIIVTLVTQALWRSTICLFTQAKKTLCTRHVHKCLRVKAAPLVYVHQTCRGICLYAASTQPHQTNNIAFFFPIVGV